MSPVPKRAATYLRVSRSDQSSALQCDETKRFVEARGWTLGPNFSDEGISGAKRKRPALTAMLAAARRRHFDVLVVYRADRLFRSLTELVQTIDELASLGIGFASCTEPFDTTTSSGRLLLQIVGAFAEFERNVLRERTRDGMAAARARGARIGRPRRAVDPELVARLRGNGMRWRDISRELGVPERTLLRLRREPRERSDRNDLKTVDDRSGLH